MEKQKFNFSYFGNVKSFGKVVEEGYYAETIAVSEEKARSNFAYRYKREHGLTAGAKIELPGKITKD